MDLSQLIERGNKAFRANAANGRPTGIVHDAAMANEIRERRQLGNPTHVVRCHACQIWHPIFSDHHMHLQCAVDDFRNKHEKCGYWSQEATNDWVKDGDNWKRDGELKKVWKSALECTSVPIWSADGWIANSDVKQAFATETSMTVTNLHSLASSATAGWFSASVDNSSNLYLAVLIAVHIAAVNTAPGSDKAAYLFAFGSTDGSIFTSTGTSGGTVGTEGAGTYPSISTLPCVAPQVGVIPYPVQNKALDAGPFEVARAFGGVLPKAWALGIVNFTGFTFAASANTVKHLQAYSTVI